MHLFCKNCGAPIEKGEAVCPHCGTEIALKKDSSKKSKRKYYVIGFIVLIMICLVSLAFFYQMPNAGESLENTGYEEITDELIPLLENRDAKAIAQLMKPIGESGKQSTLEKDDSRLWTAESIFDEEKSYNELVLGPGYKSAYRIVEIGSSQPGEPTYETIVEDAHIKYLLETEATEWGAFYHYPDSALMLDYYINDVFSQEEDSYLKDPDFNDYPEYKAVTIFIEQVSKKGSKKTSVLYEFMIGMVGEEWLILDFTDGINSYTCQ